MKLYKHQQDIVDEGKHRAGLFLGTGSGKTITALHLASGPTLVICPKTVRDDRVWEKNLEKCGIDRDVDVISKEDFRLKKFNTSKYYETIIGDEAHQLAGVMPDVKWKNKRPIPKTSAIYEKLEQYIAERKPENVYMLTATPIRNPMCVYGLAKLLGVKWNFYEFRDTFYFEVKKGYRSFFIVKDALKERLGQAVQTLGYTGRLEDYFDVPEQIYKDYSVGTTDVQKKRLREIAIEFPDPLVLTGKRHQIENGVLKGDEFSATEAFKCNKTDIIKELASEFPKMVIFAKFTQQIADIKKELSDYKVLTLQGSTKNREQVIKDAEESDNCIIVVQSQVSAGYELPSFPVMVFASLDYSIVNYTQAIGRIQRANAIKKNLYIHLLAGEIDVAVYKSIKNKEDFSERIYSDSV